MLCTSTNSRETCRDSSYVCGKSPSLSWRCLPPSAGDDDLHRQVMVLHGNLCHISPPCLNSNVCVLARVRFVQSALGDNDNVALLTFPMLHLSFSTATIFMLIFPWKHNISVIYLKAVDLLCSFFRVLFYFTVTAIVYDGFALYRVSEKAHRDRRCEYLSSLIKHF